MLSMRNDSEPSAILAKRGLRSTQARIDVLSVLLETRRSLSHAELAALLGGLDRITIFRSLKTLKKSGILHSVRSLDGVLRYVVNPVGGEGCPGSHPHFLCLECGTMTCLAEAALPRVEVPEGTQVRGKQFLIYGSCAACAGKHVGRPAKNRGEGPA